MNYKYIITLRYPEEFVESEINILYNNIKQLFENILMIYGSKPVRSVTIKICKNGVITIAFESDSDLRYANYMCESLVYDNYTGVHEEIFNTKTKSGAIMHPVSYDINNQ